MGEKSNPLGGQRSQTRHNLENLGGFGIFWVILNRIDSLDSAEKMVIMGAGMAICSAIAKFISSNGIDKKLLKKIGLGGLVVLIFSGCAFQVGTIDPERFEGSNGETIVACQIKGLSWSVGDADICRNVEGGQVSEMFTRLVTGTLEAAARIVGGLFAGVGAAGASLTQTVPAVPPLPVTPPAIVEPTSSSGLF